MRAVDGRVPVRPADRPDWTDRVLDLDVGAVAHGGHCVARHEGRVVFVRHALPGERVRAVVDEDGGGSYCRADAVAVLVPSPDRVEAPCGWARAGGCGGCDFQHVEPGAQRALKAAVLAEQLRRLAGIEREVEVEELPGGVLGWRHRVRLAVDDLGRPGLRAHRSHDVLPIADCPLTPAGTLPPVLEREFGPGTEVEVAVAADGRVHAGDGPVLQRAAGREWLLSPGVFWQVHPALPDTLADVVREWAAAPGGGTAWDLYGGVGLFAAVLAGQVGPDGRVVVVESARRRWPTAGRRWPTCPRCAGGPAGSSRSSAPWAGGPTSWSPTRRARAWAGRWSTRSAPPVPSGWCTWRAIPPPWPATSACSPGAATT
jgi:tRNA/tmRNA/rRNA uracil-C5-methylase (TrmA/RlmC/RlmD family)